MDVNGVIVNKTSEVMVFDRYVFYPWSESRTLCHLDTAFIVFPDLPTKHRFLAQQTKIDKNFFHEI